MRGQILKEQIGMDDIGDAANFASLLDARIQHLSACANECAPETRDSVPFYWQAKALQDLREEVAFAGALSTEPPSVGGGDVRTIFMVRVGGFASARIVAAEEWEETLTKHLRDHRNLEESGGTLCKFAQVAVAPRPTDRDLARFDFRYALVEDVRGDLNASIHFTPGEVARAIAVFDALNGDLIESREAGWTAHPILIPPRGPPPGRLN